MGLKPVIAGQGFYEKSAPGSGSGDMLAANNLSDLASKPTALTNLEGTTLGVNLFKIANPGAITFPRFNADNTPSALSASDFRTAIGAGTSSFDGAWGSLSGKPANVVSFGSLGDSGGVLTNDGLGAFSYTSIGSSVGTIVGWAPDGSGEPSIVFAGTLGRLTYLTGAGTAGPATVVNLPSISGTLALTSDIPAAFDPAIPGAIGGTTPSAGTFTTLVAGSTTSLLLGTAGSAVGNIGFRNATSGTATLAPPTGALGAYTVTLPGVASTLATLGANIFTGEQYFNSTTISGLRANNLTTAQKNALTAAAGMIVFDTDLGRFQSYSGAAWVSHVRVTGDTMTGSLTNSSNGAASAPGLYLTGAPFTGGSGTTTFPYLFIQPTGTTACTSWNTSGTFIGLNSPVGYGGDWVSFRSNGGLYERFRIGPDGTTHFNNHSSSGMVIDTGNSRIALTSAWYLNWNDDTRLYREAAQHLTEKFGTTACIFSVANTWTSTTNFERFKIDWAGTANTCRIGTSKGASGSARAMNIEIGDTAVIKLGTAGEIGFFGTAAAARPTGVTVDAAGIHAALVTLGLITA